MSAELSGRVTVLENQISFLSQDLLQKIDISAASNMSVNWNQQLDTLESTIHTMRSQLQTLQNLYSQLNIQFKQYTGTISGYVGNIYVTGKRLQNNVYFSGIDGLSFLSSGQAVIVSSPGSSRAMSLAEPVSGDAFTVLYNTGSTVYVDQIFHMMNSTGVGSSSVTWNLYKDTGRANTGIPIMSNDIVTSNLNTGFYITSVSNRAIPSGYFLWLEVSDVLGVATELFSNITLTKN